MNGESFRIVAWAGISAASCLQSPEKLCAYPQKDVHSGQGFSGSLLPVLYALASRAPRRL